MEHKLEVSGDTRTMSRRYLIMLLLLFVLAFGIRLAFLPIAPNNTTDAWSRFHEAQLWSSNPGVLPKETSEGAWLPLHFWLLGSVLWLTKSEMSLRVFTAFLGALTVVFCWGIVRHAFDPTIALLSAVLLALFDFHIAFSITTGSEVPTIFFLAVGVYCWLRYTSEWTVPWVLLSAVMFSIACLCRFEAWLCAPVLTLMTVDTSRGWVAALSDRSRVNRALGFGLLASGGAFGWMLFSLLRWGDPLALLHRTAADSHSVAAVLRHPVGFRLLMVPVSLATSLSPLILILAGLGLSLVLVSPLRPARSLGVLAMTLFAFNYYSSVHYETTQARYTLPYSWLLFPFALEALRWLVAHWRRLNFPQAVGGMVIFFLLWQVGIVLGAEYARPAIADRLAVMSPMIPLGHEMRDLVEWLQNNRRSSTIILDDFNRQSATIMRFAHLDPSKTFPIGRESVSDPARLQRDLDEFARARHPVLCVCSPYGPIGTTWSIRDAQDINVRSPAIHLRVLWRGKFWRVYSIADR